MSSLSDTPGESAYRPRRAHKKSRGGCSVCKQRRIKCDEARPRCSRCEKRDFCCQYPERRPSNESPVEDSQSRGADMMGYHSDSLLAPSPSHTHFGSLSPSSAPNFVGLSPSPSFSPEEFVTSPPGPQPADNLDATEMELFSHYLSHTSRVMAFDSDDLYALRVGITNLAFHCKPLMSSILAVAATCKCHDIINQTDSPLQNKEEIRELLAFAEQHHSASLREIQVDISKVNQYDYILANAPLMVLYGSASHCLRIRLTEMWSGETSLPSEFIPTQSQWISLIRAVHMAYDGLLNDQPEFPSPVQQASSEPRQIEPQATVGGDAFLAEDGPTEVTKSFLLPIISGTSGVAMEKLRTRAHSAGMVEMFGTGQSYSPELLACYSALDVLKEILSEVLSPGGDSTPSSATINQLLGLSDTAPLGRLEKVSPWLRKYLGRVTSATNPGPLRRTITAFLNRVPAEYLNLIQGMLNEIPVQVGDEGQVPWAIHPDLLQLDETRQLAMNIFAHWLVLVLLLDGVWWIGGIGAWELRRVVSFMKGCGLPDGSNGTGQDWWPESMYNVAKELGKHRDNI